MSPEFLTLDERKKLWKGGRLEIGNGIYSMCRKCYGLVKINKWFFGSIHLCEPEGKSVPNG